MKSIRHLILGFSALLLLAACGPSRYTSSNVNLASIPEYAFIQPYSYIVLYGDDGKGFYNENSSATATRVITNIIESERFPFSDMIPADYEGENADIAKWLQTFPNVYPAKADRLRVPKSLKRMMDKSGLRYACATIEFFRILLSSSGEILLIFVSSLLFAFSRLLTSNIVSFISTKAAMISFLDFITKLIFSITICFSCSSVKCGVLHLLPWYFLLH